MKLLLLSIFALLYMVPMIKAIDQMDNVAELIRQGNIHELSKLLAPSVEITILDEENVYSKTQAELILDKFFSQNKPKTVKILHKVNSSPNYRFAVILVNTDNGVFRITYTLKQTDGSLMLIEMRIETEKIK